MNPSPHQASAAASTQVSGMDVRRARAARPARFPARRLVLGLLVMAALVTLWSLLKPAVPTVERGLVLIDTVKRGELLRQVRGAGTLLAEDTRWIAARTAGRVERVLLRPGAVVTVESVILVLSNPEVEQAASAASSQLMASEAELVSLRVSLEREVLAAESALATARAEREQSKLRARLNEELFQQGLVSEIDFNLSRVSAQHAEARLEIETKRAKFSHDSINPQLAVKQAEVDRARALVQLRQQELASLEVRAGVNGVLQVLPIESGTQVQPGVNLARVADPSRLKAQIRVAETQTRELQVGQRVVIDTRDGVIEGRVERIDPTVQANTVAVDVTLSGELPRGARPDLSVDGVIELERINNVLTLARPTQGQEGGLVGVYKLDTDGRYATSTKVRLGRSSINTVEILEGLQLGDRVILSDMSQWGAHPTIQLK